MHILITVSSGDPRTSELAETAQCLTVFVAVDESGKPAAVAPWVPVTVLDQRRQIAARRRIAVRSSIEAAMATQRYSDDSTAPRKILRFLAAPTDVNWGGKVHGGNVMRWIDEAAYVCASEWTRDDVVSSYVGGIRFYRPILIGNLIEVDARLIHTSHKTMHVCVHVKSIDPRSGEGAIAAHALSMFVALDERGRSKVVRQWTPQSDEDRSLDQHARALLEIRRRAE